MVRGETISLSEERRGLVVETIFLILGFVAMGIFFPES
jgi:hypothetical protein